MFIVDTVGLDCDWMIFTIDVLIECLGFRSSGCFGLGGRSGGRFDFQDPSLRGWLVPL